MDKEKTNSIREAKAALNQIHLELAVHPIGSPARESLEDAAVVLESIIWKLVNQDLRQITGDLALYQQRLKELTQEMEGARDALENTTRVISKVSSALNVLLNLV